MGKKKKQNSPPTPSIPPQIYEATLGANGGVVKGPAIAQAQAETMRHAGQDVVVCGPD
jgi:hypothetical protein